MGRPSSYPIPIFHNLYRQTHQSAASPGYYVRNRCSNEMRHFFFAKCPLLTSWLNSNHDSYLSIFTLILNDNFLEDGKRVGVIASLFIYVSVYNELSHSNLLRFTLWCHAIRLLSLDCFTSTSSSCDPAYLHGMYANFLYILYTLDDTWEAAVRIDRVIFTRHYYSLCSVDRYNSVPVCDGKNSLALKSIHYLLQIDSLYSLPYLSTMYA